MKRLISCQVLLILKSHQHLLINRHQSILLIEIINMPYKHQSPYASSINKNLSRDEIRNKIHDYVKGLIDKGPHPIVASRSLEMTTALINC